MASPRTYVLGVGITEFVRPFSKQWDYPDMAREAGSAALRDAGVTYEVVEAVVASYCYGEPTCGQRAIYELGLTGVPVFNVNNNCSSGSSALMLAKHLVESGHYRTVMAIGFEKMEHGLSERYEDRCSPVAKHFAQLTKLGAPPEPLPQMNQMTSEVIRLYAYAAREYLKRYPQNCSSDDFAQIAVKNREHGLQNPRAYVYKSGGQISLQKALKDRMICEPITVYQSSVTADGAACAIVCGDNFLHNSATQNQRERAVEILAQEMCTDFPSSFTESGGYRALSGYDMAKQAAAKCYRTSGVTPNDVDVLEVHDCFAPNELFMYEALQLAPEGAGAGLLRSGCWIRNKNGGKVFRMGKWVVNASGGLEAKGHPIGATGLAQCYELVTQIRGEADKRQVPGAKVGLQHNFGIGGAAVVTIYGNGRRPRKTEQASKL